MANNRGRLLFSEQLNQTNPRDQGKRPQGVRKSKAQKPTRKSARLITRPSKHFGQQYQAKTLDRSTSPPPRRRKRSREAEELSIDVAVEPSAKRPRASAALAASRLVDPETQSSNTETPLDPIDYWRKEQAWPKEYFEPDRMAHLLPSKRSTPSFGRKRSEGSLGASSTTPSDQKPRGEKSAPYGDTRYETLLATKGSFMDTSEQGIVDSSKAKCQELLEKRQAVPQESLFRDDLFESTCRKIRSRNEARIVRDISLLIVPSAETLATYGAKELEILIEATNEGWNNSSPLTSTRPQPDYSVGFKREAFSDEQLKKLSPFIGNFIAGDQSFFMATYYMYFPFLTCEVKCGAAALDIADRQNAHSMTLAVRAVVELFRLVGREAEIDREILAFSVSHDHRSVRIYGHYAVINGKNTTFYRHPIHDFSFTAQDGKEKWTAYNFTKNVYDVWMPIHFKSLCSVIDQLPPELDFDVAPLPQDSGLSRDLESYHLSQSFAESIPHTGNDGSQLDYGDSTPNTSITGQGTPKRPKRKVAE